MGFYFTIPLRYDIIYAQQGRFFRQFFTSESRRTLKKRKTIFYLTAPLRSVILYA